MELRQLKHFLAVVEAGSFHKAAARVNLTQQAISRSVQRLERELGVRLLERKKGDRRKVGPSPIGLLLLPVAQKTLAEIKVFNDEVENFMGTGRDLVRLGAAPTAARSLLPAVIREFRRHRPKARVQVMRQVTAAVLENLANGLFDIAICDEPDGPLDPRFSALPLFMDRNIFAVRAGHPLLSRRRLALQDLLDIPWIAVGPFCRGRNELSAMLKTAGLVFPTHAIETSSVELTVRHLLDDDFISFIPVRLVNDELVAGRLVRLAVRQPRPLTWSTLLVQRVNAVPTAAQSQFIDTTRTVAKQLARL